MGEELRTREERLRELDTLRAGLERTTGEPFGPGLGEAEILEILDMIPHMIFAKDRDGRFLLANRAVAEAYGLPAGAIIGEDHRRLHANEAEVARMLADDCEVITSGRPKFIFEQEFTDVSGVVRILQTTKVPFDPGGSGERAVLGLAVDVTRHRRLERILAGESHVQQLMTQGAPLPEVLGALIALIEGEYEGSRGSILLLDSQGTNLRLVAAPNLPRAFVEQLDGLSVGPESASCGTAAFCGTPVIVEDIAADPVWRNLREVAIGNGLRACWSQPILSSGGRVLGTFAMYYGERRRPSDDERALIVAAARLAGVAIEFREAHESLEAEVLEHRRTTKLLRQREEEFRATFENAPLGLVTVDLAGNFLRVNQAFCEITGYDEEELLAMTFRDITHPDDLEKSLEAFERAAGGEFFVRNALRKRCMRKDGKVVEVALYMVKIRDRIDGSTKMVAQVVDHSREVRAEEEYRATFENAPLALASADLMGNILRANQVFCDLMGYDQEELLGMSFRDLTHPDDLEESVKWREALLKGEDYVRRSLRKRYVRKDGKVVEATVHLVKTRDRTDGSTKVLAQVVDHTRELRAEEEYKATFENAALGITVADPAGNFVRVNQAFCDIMGYEKEEMLRMSFKDITHADDLKPSATLVDHALSGEFFVRHQLRKRYVRKDGNVVEATVYLVKIRDRADGSTKIVAQVVDHTREVRAEEEARKHRERLTHVARVSTLGEMAASIAHEVNQPLTAIATFAQASSRLIRKGSERRDDLLSTMDRIGAEAIRAGEIIHRIRALARRGKSGRARCDVNSLVREVAKLAEVDARLNGLSIELDLAQRLPRVVADGVQIQQVLLNLIRNGIEASEGMNGSGGVVTVCTEESGDQVEVSVVDQGTGLGLAAGQQVFDPFFTTKDSGMGLGLSIGRSIVASHGGRMWFVPNDGPGTTFKFTLPIDMDVSDD